MTCCLYLILRCMQMQRLRLQQSLIARRVSSSRRNNWWDCIMLQCHRITDSLHYWMGRILQIGQVRS
ncbi:hypothetical protein FGO68_gene4208 [Halteria grandinella]|uniref:Uncharacterized protein n=1 Tax=Halteria grandinella TaxID=5974 RepID=A0A8J8T3W7_HALGN|nr:hypothetical protein FGO68_gene4208 [Halteria grandinella]